MTPDQILDLSLREIIAGGQETTFKDASKNISQYLEILVNQGVLNLGPDHTLSGKSLEIRTRIIFESLGYSISAGREGFEDFIVSAPDDFSPKDPIVLEVKSSRKAQISRDNLRQLDDWVFDLSGEEKARKHGLGGGPDAMSITTGGMLSAPRKHPSPHKGVFIFNRLLGMRFDERQGDIISPNEIEFVVKRNFCVIPIEILLTYLDAFNSDSSVNKVLWENIHSTSGVLEAFLPSGP